MFGENVRVIFLVYLCLLFELKQVSAKEEEIRTPVLGFRKHSVVQPVVHHGRTKRQISTTRDVGGVHHPVVTITVAIDDEELILDLRLNQELIADNHVLSYQENGKTVVQQPKREELDFCHYGGRVRDKPGSWAAVSTCHGVQGAVFDGYTVRYIEPAHGDLTGEHYVFDHLDLSDSSQDGDLNNFHHLNIKMKPKESSGSRKKREISYNPQSYGPYIENEKSRYVELAFVLDHSQYKANGANLLTVYHNTQIYANIINSVYVPLNIFITLVGVEIWNDRNKIELHNLANVTLNNFNEYRKKQLLNRIPHDNAHFLTGQKFDNNVVGLAYVGSMCTFAYSSGLTYNHTDKIGLLAMTTAHEMGHNFGMNHDESSKCFADDYIMKSQSDGKTPTSWSPCSLKSLRSYFRDGIDYCLRNKPNHLKPICEFSRGRRNNCVSSDPFSMCGNGLVDPGEQCDCGTMRDTHPHDLCHQCCDPKTCTLRANATCGAGQCCDLQTCRPKSLSTVCRSAKNECDLPEYCTGESGNCPEDVHKMDTTPCGKGERSAYCLSGNCRSHTDQCRLLYGSTGQTGPNECYKEKNVRDSSYGNCGYDMTRALYKKCPIEHTMCGRLQCTRNGPLQYGTFRSSDSASTVWVHGRQIWCNTVRIDVGLRDVDPGLVPDGAKCGHDKMCLNQKCVSVSEIREQKARSGSAVCPTSCGHGVCNSKGHCHCDPGFLSPLCESPGAGGSTDSGSASDPSTLETFKVVMYAIFLGILPFTVLVLLLIYFIRSNGFTKSNDFLKKLLHLECINTGKTTKNVPDPRPIQVNVSNPTPYQESNTIYANTNIFNKSDIHAPIQTNIGIKIHSQKNSDNISSYPNDHSERTTQSDATRSDANYVNKVSPISKKPTQDSTQIYANVPIVNTKRPTDNLVTLPNRNVTQSNANSPGSQLPGRTVNIPDINKPQALDNKTRPETRHEQRSNANNLPGKKVQHTFEKINVSNGNAVPKPIDTSLPVKPLVNNISKVNLKKSPNNINLPNKTSQEATDNSNFLGVRLKKVNKDTNPSQNTSQDSGNINFKNLLKPPQCTNSTSQHLPKIRVDNLPNRNLNSTRTSDNVANLPFRNVLKTRDDVTKSTGNNDSIPKRNLKQYEDDVVKNSNKSLLKSSDNVPNSTHGNKKIIPPKPLRKINNNT